MFCSQLTAGRKNLFWSQIQDEPYSYEEGTSPTLDLEADGGKPEGNTKEDFI